MVKIKTEKKMKFPELVHWVWNSKKFGRNFISDNGSLVRFGNYGDLIEVFSIDKSDLFTVEVEEEITEETKVPQLLEIYSYSGRNSINACVYNDESIAEERDVDSISFHMINPDGTTTTLWTEEGGMVE